MCLVRFVVECRELQCPDPAFHRRQGVSSLYRLSVVVCVVVLISPRAVSQNSDLDLKSYDPDKLTFVRIVYDSVGGDGEAFYRGDAGWIPRWATDHPVAAKNLTFRLNQLTTIQANQGSLLLRLNDSRLLDYPFIFIGKGVRPCKVP